MIYKEAMEYMNKIGKKGSVLGLSTMTALLECLGNPQNALPVIHVAGTNGKGSICTFLACMYQSEGKKVGRYSSPTLFTYLERFQMNGTSMDEDTFCVLVEDVKNAIKIMKENGQEVPTAFEVETAIAFLYFLREKADIVILETGMGGRLDATNVVEHPLCTVFSAIGMDHMQFLGDTLEEITYQKAGIIKSGCPVVSYPNPGTVCDVLRQEYQKCNEENELPEFLIADDKQVQVLEENLDGSRFVYKGVEYSISLAGDYQIYNAITAIETKLLLDGALEKESLNKACWPARFEKISERPLFIRDGAHNIDGVRALKRSIKKYLANNRFTNNHLIFIIGILKDKEYKKMIAELCPMADEVFTITPPGERGLSGEILRQDIMPYCEKVTFCDTVPKACQNAVSQWNRYAGCQESAIIIAWGSLSYMGLI